MDAKITQVKGGVTMRLEGMIARGRNVSAYLNRNLMEQFRIAQNERFQSENSSQQGTWKRLSPVYEKRKRKQFAAFPGAGRAMMVATGRLASGAMAKDENYYLKVITDRQFLVAINLSALPYAKYPGATRTFMSFNTETLTRWHRGISDYVFRGRS